MKSGKAQGSKTGKELDFAQGEYLVRLARRTVGTFLSKGFAIEPERLDGVLGLERGVFVTIEEYPSKELRGCIGYPLPQSKLAQAVIENAINACSEDPRFAPMEESELSSVVFEVSVLSVPKDIEYKDRLELPKLVKVGRDGLIVRRGWQSGLLLPQVPVEWKWDSEQFLSHTCEKAGLPPGLWKQEGLKFQSFQAQIFAEQTPGGKVIEKEIA